MTKLEYIALYKKSLSKYTSDVHPEFKIDDEYIYHLGITAYNDPAKIWYSYSIDNCLKIVDIFHNAHDYIYSLKIGDTITLESYGSIDTATIQKINYGKIKLANGTRRISSFTIKTLYERLARPVEVVFRGSTLESILDVYRYFSPRGYKFFDKYGINNANEIIAKNEG